MKSNIFEEHNQIKTNHNFWLLSIASIGQFFLREINMSKLISLFYFILHTGNSVIYSAHHNCFPSEIGNSKNNFPDSISADTIFKITGVSPNICGITMKKWPYGDNLFIVYSEDKLEFKIHILQKVNNHFKLISEYTDELGDYRFKEFDFAPYTLKKNNTAMGIRFFASGPKMGGGWECIRLKLFEFADYNIRLVLSTLVEYEAEGNNVAYDIDTYFSNYETALIIIGKPDASGYNKIIKRIEKDRFIYIYKDSTYTEDKVSGYSGNLIENCFCP